MKRRKLKALSYAKINLSLNVSGKNSSGLHSLDSVTASVDLTDAVTVCERFDSRINITYNGNKKVYDNDSVLRAVECLRRRYGPFGMDIAVEKHLPEGAGLGGSSADAAAVLVLADELFGFFGKGFDMTMAAREIGSDVPIMTIGGYCRLGGVGDRAERLEGERLDLVICCGGEGVSTHECFRQFDREFPSGRFMPSDNEALIKALRATDLDGVAKQCKNALTEPAIKLNGNIKIRLDALKNTGAKAVFMTGSGSGCVGLFESGEQAEQAADILNRDSRAGKAISLSTVAQGVKII